MLADALNPYHGLFDNIMTNISFQIWPLLFGTHYGRVCHLDLFTCSRPVHEAVPHTASWFWATRTESSGVCTNSSRKHGLSVLRVCSISFIVMQNVNNWTIRSRVSPNKYSTNIGHNINYWYKHVIRLSISEDPLVQWLARGAVTTGRLRLTNSKVTGSNPVWVEIFCHSKFFWTANAAHMSLHRCCPITSVALRSICRSKTRTRTNFC